MGSVEFDMKNKTVEIVEGQPFRMNGANEYGRIFDRNLDLIRMVRAMRIAVPPEEMILTFAGQTGLKAMIGKVFGSGQRGSTTMFWWPTGAVDAGYRAWVRHQQWTEGGGDGWIGRPIEHDWIVAGALIAEIPFREFSKQLFTEHPLGKLLWKEMEGDKYGFTVWDVYAPVGSNPREWVGVEILEEGFKFLKADGYDVEHRNKIPGVYREYKAQFGQWQGKIFVYEPNMWEIMDVAYGTYCRSYPHLQARNGRTVLRFVLPKDIKKLSYEERRELKAQYSTELPELPGYELPADVSGKYATFWDNKEEFLVFARKWNIEAKEPFMGIHDPREGLMIPMLQGWAELAWREGARKIPPGLPEVPDDFLSWKRNSKSSYDSDRIIPEEITALKNFSAYIYSNPGEFARSCIHAPNNFHGWLKMPRGLALPYGCSVREDGDVVDEREHELIVYTPSGRVCLPK